MVKLLNQSLSVCSPDCRRDVARGTDSHCDWLTDILSKSPTCPDSVTESGQTGSLGKNLDALPNAKVETTPRQNLEPPTHSDDIVLAVCALLLLAVGAVFGQTVWHGFINYDDNLYVYENTALTRGMTVEGIIWALTTTDGNFWHPLTWISFLLDFQLYGLKPWGYHLTNVLLHAASTVLLFLVLQRMTGRFGPSAFVAAVFAIHPLHVESVAWVAERKDVLSGLFFMLTLWAYVGYVHRPFSLLRYLAVVLLFALGLMAKPVLVTLPFVLLLLDYWPLGRMDGADGVPTKQRALIPWRLVVEKIPLLVLAAVFCVVTPLAEGDAVTRLDVLPLSWRLANAPVAYVAYLAKLFCPVGLALPYPHPGNALPVWQVAGSLVLLAGISAAAWVYRRQLPYLFVGWFWYLGILVPMIGLVQVGEHAMADRYTYLTQIGLYIALAWGAAQIVASWPRLRQACTVASAVVVLGLMGCAWCQASYWRDSEILWTHTLACTSQNAVAHSNLGNVLVSRGRLDAAITHFREAVCIKPNDTEHYNNLGIALAGRGELDEAILQYQKALQINPDDFKAHTNLGAALAGRRQFDAAHENLLAEFDYDLLLDGKRSGVIETDDADHTTTIDWVYDQLGRITRESYDSYGTANDFIADYAYDLVGNRLTKKADTNPTFSGDPSYDETITYTYDLNDRLLTETKDLSGTTNDRFTRYEYGPNALWTGAGSPYGGDGTQQTHKKVYAGLDASGAVKEDTAYTYNLQGRMASSVVDLTGSGGGTTTSTYEYADNGTRVSQTVGGTMTVYSYDKQNPTGNAQILEEKNAGLTVTKTYTLGHDVIAQQAPAAQSGAVLYLFKDGHGSTRSLVDATGQIINANGAAQVFRYDAFGNRIDSVNAVTSLLYGCEQTDATGLQYLRARYYNPATARFSSLDPFVGSMDAPQSLHKYLFCHGDGINYSDPTGHFEGLAGMMVSMSISNVMMSVMSPIIKPAVEYLAYGLFPIDLIECQLRVATESAAMIGGTFAGSGNLGAVTAGAGVGAELLFGGHHSTIAGYGYREVHVGVFGDIGAALGVKVGCVLNAPKVRDYKGPFRSVSIPGKILSPGTRSFIAEWASTLAACYAEFYRQILQATTEIHVSSDVIIKGREILSNVLSNVLENGGVTFFWTPGQPMAGSGAFGFSLDYQFWGKGGSGLSYSMSWYTRLLGDDNADF